ncbi:hypothetical protein ACVOMT_03535 [Sphingomonas panni]
MRTAVHTNGITNGYKELQVICSGKVTNSFVASGVDLQTAIERVRHGRARRGWAAAQLAAQAVAAAAARGVAIDLTQQAVSYFENGKTKVVPPWVQYALSAIDGDVVLQDEDELDLVPLEEVDLDYGLGAAYGDSPVSVQVHKMPRLLMEAMSESPSTSLFVTRGVGDLDAAGHQSR